jgi:hypothetical protein
LNTSQIFDIATPGVVIGMLAGGIIVLILVILLISLVETVIITLLGWAEFKKSLGISILMNSISGILGGILLVLVPRPALEDLIIAMVLSILVEGIIMLWTKTNSLRLTLIAVALANLASYAIILFPAYYYSLA